MADDPILEIRDLSCSIGGHEVLHDIRLDVKGGETIVLLGRSGSGKTTLLKTVNGLIAPTSGNVRFAGRAATEWDPIELRRRMGYVIQDAGLFPHWTVERNIGLVPRLAGWEVERIRLRVSELLAAVGMGEEYRGRYPRELSGGQKQRVGIARALAADPPLLLFDEPFAALDPITRLELQRLFLELRRSVGKTSLFVTHDIREAMMLASRIALLKDGRVEVVAAPREFLKAESEEARAFLAGLGELETAP
uniref:ABC transporter related n=1 Tax=Solibacter usitatus (strain Ellin6076) TaxID=234267 RepID=Q029S7_SOLUE